MGHDKGVRRSCCHPLPRPNLPELDIAESVEHKAQSICIQSLLQPEATGTGMPLLNCHLEARILESMNHCHLYVFLFQCNLCSANGTRTPGSQAQPHDTLDDLTSMRWVHALPRKGRFPESPPCSDISMFRAPGGKDADGYIQLPPLSKSSTPLHLPLDLSMGLCPLCQEAFCTGCPQWLKSGRAVSEEWQ